MRFSARPAGQPCIVPPLRTTLVLALIVSSCAVLATALSAGATPPQAEAMVLTQSDFPHGATTALESPAVSSDFPKLAVSSGYTRAFTQAVIGKTRLLTLVSSAGVAVNSDKATAFMQSAIFAAQSTFGRQAILRSLKSQFELGSSSKTRVLSDGFIRDRRLRTGDAALDVAFFVKIPVATIYANEIFVREGAALQIVIFASIGHGVSAGESFQLAKTMVAHMKAAGAGPPQNTALPTVAGSPVPGQVLTAAGGTWLGASVTYTTQWLKCNASGRACAAISGATGSSYTVAPTDAGSTIEVAIEATNPSGNSTATSQATPLVSSG